MSKAVEILITGRDEASRPLKKVADSTDHLKSSMDKANGSGGSLMSGLGGFAGPLAIVAGGFLAAKSAAAAAQAAFDTFTNLVSGSIEAWAVQEEAMQGNSQALQDFAGQMQNATNVGDEVILNAMQMARGMGVSDDKMKDLTQSAIALSASTGKPLEESMKIMAQSTLKGTEALHEAFPALEHITDEAERNSYITERLGEGWAKAQGDTDTLSGALSALGNNWGDMLEKIGQLLAPFIKKISDWFGRIAPVIQSVIAKALPIMQMFAEKMQEVAIWIGEKLVYAFTFIETAVMNWKQVMAIAVLTVYGKFLEFVENVKHFFTVTIPGVVKWFADNFLNIFRDLFVAYITMWKNRIFQVIDMFKLLWSVLTGDIGAGDAMMKAGEIAGRNLLEGFVATTSPIPDLITRQLTPEEQAIKGATKGLTDNFMDKVDTKFEERMGFWKDEFGKSFEMEFDAKGAVGNLNLEMGATKKERAKEPKEEKAADMKATEGRLLSRGRISEAQKSLKVAEDQKKLQESMNQFLEDAVGFLNDLVNKEPTEVSI
ncbi:hypothetical protein CMK18_23920 [Candidatus Poribacteria bacterium]|nr:hypothetical protein [Candidatus Poribacteria bacterium]